jgi:hypothetical protein
MVGNICQLLRFNQLELCAWFLLKLIYCVQKDPKHIVQFRNHFHFTLAIALFVKVFMNSSSEDEAGSSDSSDSSPDITTKEEFIKSIPSDIRQICSYLSIDKQVIEKVFCYVFELRDQFSIRNVLEVQQWVRTQNY